MKDRLLEFLRAENKSSAQLAEEIGVQPSGISHILSGRNNPSLDFVLKMLEKYQFISTDWLLFGKGSMYKDSKMQSLFDENADIGNPDQNISKKVIMDQHKIDFQQNSKGSEAETPAKTEKSGDLKTVKIVWFFSNNTFKEFFPG